MNKEYQDIWRSLIIKKESKFPKKFSNYIMSWNICDLDYFEFTNQGTDFGVTTLTVTEWADSAQTSIIRLQDLDSSFNADSWNLSSIEQTYPLELILRKDYGLTKSQQDLFIDILFDVVSKIEALQIRENIKK